MTVLLLLLFFSIFLLIDYFKTSPGKKYVMNPGTQYTTPGFEYLGAFAQDGGKPVEKDHADQSPKAKVSPLKG